MNTIKKIYFIIAGAAVLGTSCSKEYLQTTPTDSWGESEIFSTVENAQVAMNGVYRCMTQQYGGFGLGFNGEGTIKYYIGNFGGNNYNLANSGNVAAMNQTYHDSNTSTFILYPWYYYYRIISNCNSILKQIDAATGSEAGKANVKGQALTVRAYSYMMLSQLFHKRWIDGHQGEAKNGNGLVLRLEPTQDPMPLSSATATFTQIYKDLDAAIANFTTANISRKNNFTADINVAYAVYARAALVRLDYTNAAKYAKLARAGYPLMDNDSYLKGFNTPTSEWIWSSYGGETETLYYYSFFAYVAYNANTSQIRNYPRCIYRVLYDKIPSTDLRKGMFLDPKTDSYNLTTGFATSGSALYKRGFAMRDGIASSAKIAAWMQFKFACLDGVGVGNLNHFRSSEMYLIEAEAQYRLGNENAAREALVELTKTSGRDPEYKCTKTGTALLDEIKLYRGIELWGEGFEFFDLKRWGDNIDRKGFKNGGNWGSRYVVKVTPDQYNEWTNVIPLKETDYNDQIK